ncbi:MAG: hypothetical protein U1E25_03705 [Methylocystis sp.]
MRRHPIIGLAVPARHVEDFDVGIGEAQSGAKGGRPRRVARDMNEDRRAALGLARQRARKVSADEGVEAVRRMGENQPLAFDEAGARRV